MIKCIVLLTQCYEIIIEINIPGRVKILEEEVTNRNENSKSPTIQKDSMVEISLLEAHEAKQTRSYN